MSRKANKSSSTEAEQTNALPIEETSSVAEDVVDPVIPEQIESNESLVPEVDPYQAEVDRLNKVNDLEKAIIQHQEAIKQLRSELRKLENKTKREGPTKMEMCLELWKSNPGLTRKEYVQMFQDQCGLTVAGSRTYVQLILAKNK